MTDPVRVFTITQATAAIFSGLYIRLTFLCFVRTGSKHILCPVNGELIGHPGDLIVFPPDSMVSMENRPVLNANYCAQGVNYSREMVKAVFEGAPVHRRPGVQILRAETHQPARVLDLLETTLADETLPPAIRAHRLLEPLIWLRENNIALPLVEDDHPLGRFRELIETDLARAWRVADVARHFAMSEATFRRWIARSGLGFTKILQAARLERALELLQTTRWPVSRIALECGFATPSHFSDMFRKRFGIRPLAIRSSSD